MSRAWAVCGIILSVACLLRILRAPQQEVSRGGTVVDTSSLVAARDSSLSEAKRARASFDSLQAWIDTVPADTVWRIARRLIRDTVDTGHIDAFELVRALVLDDSACRMGNDSLRGALRLAGLRLAAERERTALLAQDCRPAPLDGSERPWTALGIVVADGREVRLGAMGVRRSGWLTGSVGAFVRPDGGSPGLVAGIGLSF